MFIKHIYKQSTGHYCERKEGDYFYVIWEVVNQRPIDPEKYYDFLNYAGDLPVVDITPPDPTTEELWGKIRQDRNGLLAQCDWTQLQDVPLSDEQKTAWQAYRQALRDVAEQVDPTNILWPTVP